MIALKPHDLRWGRASDANERPPETIEHYESVPATPTPTYPRSGAVSAVVSAYGRRFRVLRTLAFDYRPTRLRIPSGFLAHLFDQSFIDRNPQPIPFPTPIIAIDGWPRRKIGRRHTPLATRAVHVHDCIQDMPHFPFARLTPLIARKEFHNLLPFGLLEIGRVSLSEFSHSPILSDHLGNTL